MITLLKPKRSGLLFNAILKENSKLKAKEDQNAGKIKTKSYNREEEKPSSMLYEGLNAKQV